MQKTYLLSLFDAITRSQSLTLCFLRYFFVKYLRYLCRAQSLPKKTTATKDNYRNSRMTNKTNMAVVYLFDIGSSVVTDSFVLSF